ncbi:CGH_1_collapsed_G0015300.mRNA.1.CDS.1 [Saccharomyces cerevisiae]|nr:CGH_1_collapsed_G0015300.mRNA.1.CDS.1 [Saccharomyces cerevisiae]
MDCQIQESKNFLFMVCLIGVISREELGTKYHLFTRQKPVLLLTSSQSFLPFRQLYGFCLPVWKKVPKSTEYTLLIILGLKIKSALWELRLRDYPIPAISFPDTFTTGDVVFAGKMPAPWRASFCLCSFCGSAQRSPYNDANTIYGSHIILHGKWIYDFSEESEIHLNIKGSHDPYKITDDGAGLAFCWSGGTTIYVHNSTDPKEFLKN